MKVIKRDGRAVEYDRQKIVLAIEKANNEVRKNKQATLEEIDEIINYIEELDKKRILVEDIQDIIEQKLMEYKRFELAKKYIVYRYTRALVRKQNTTDESILGLIKNQNIIKENLDKDVSLISNQRDYIAGEVSKDLTKRILLPDKITKAHDEGILYFHDAEYFLQPIINSSFIKLGDMLENGTVINGKLIETPKSFRVACTVTTQIILTVASNQYGEQIIDIKHLGKYLKKSEEKIKKQVENVCKGEVSEDLIKKLIDSQLKTELTSGIQTIIYQLNTLTTANGNSPHITILINSVDEEYKKENEMITEEILTQYNEGIKDENGKKSTNNIKLLTLEEIEDSYKHEGKFNQGIVTINLVKIANLSCKDDNKFFELLDERLELCYEALMCRHYALLRTKADTSPILWRYGAIARLEKNETIDKLLKGEYSSLSLGYVGIKELVKILKGEDINEKKTEEYIRKS